jgi:membrane peptidoglycan carboxypeptidase
VSEGHRKAKPARARTKRHWALRVLGWFFALLFLAVIGGAAVFFIGYSTTPIPDPNKEFKTNTTTVTYTGGQEMGSFFEQNRESVPLSRIPKHVQAAVIAAEDRTFWTNPGVSPAGIARAAFNIARGEQLQGGSTITQQYVKIMYLNQERTLSRKYKELFISTKLSRSEDKAKILEGYLNTIYFGEGAYGIQAASQAYFDVDVDKPLTVPQAAFLATVLNNPSRFDPDENREAQQRTLERYRYVLDGMLQMGVIKQKHHDEYAKALPVLKKKEKNNRYAGTKGYLLQMVRAELVARDFSDEEIDGGGLRVKTTFDAGLQQKAVQGVVKAHPDKMDNLHIGLASVRPGTGELVAMYGGSDFLKNQLNWAKLRARPGSSFKPFAVAAALKDGVNLRDRFQGDSPIVIDGDELGNEFDRDYGRVTLLKATQESINTAFYDLIDKQMEDGPSKLVDAAMAAGIPKSKFLEAGRNNSSTVLGPDPYASPIEMANAYATFAAGGRYVPVHTISEVRDASGKLLFSDAKMKEQPTQAIEPDVAKNLNYALQQVVRKGTGERALELDRDVAGKTGTAGGVAVENRAKNAKCGGCLDGKDTLTSWWTGYTPQLSTSVLYRAGKTGESDLDPYSSDPAFFGGNWPTRTWLAYMEAAHEGMPAEEFPEPDEDQRERTPTPTQTPTQTLTQRPTQTPTQPPTQSPTPTRPKETKTPGKPRPTLSLPTEPITTTTTPSDPPQG